MATKKKRITISLPDEVDHWLDSAVTQTGLAKSEIVVHCLARFVAENFSEFSQLSPDKTSFHLAWLRQIRDASGQG